MYTEPKTWHDAKSLCTSVQGDLATIPDEGTTTFVNKNFAAKNDLWIALNDIKGDNKYEWGNGLQLGSYHNWAPGEPRSAARECVHLWIHSQHRWDDAPCTYKYSVLCERRAMNADIFCPAGWDLYLKNKVCLMPYPTLTMTWPTARKQCNVFGADLAKITDDDMNKYVQSRLVTHPNSYWIGLHKKAQSDKFTWNSEVQKATYNKADKASWQHATEYCGTVKGHDQSWGKDGCYKFHGVMCQRTAYASVSCPKGYTIAKSASACLKVSTEALEWEKARAACQKDGADLVTLDYWYINNVVGAMAKQQNQSLWIGLHDRLNDNHFQWLDVKAGVTKMKQFTSWAKHQPNDTDGTLNCVRMSGADARWYDDGCGTKRNYVCQHKPTLYGYKDTTKTEQKRTCPDGWSQSDKTCIKYNTQTLSWADARKVCQKAASGGDLVKMGGNDFASFVDALLIDKKATVDAYIGLSDKAKAGQYAWLDEQQKATFTNWHDGQPSPTSGQCAVIVNTASSDSEWSSVPCDSKKGYICQQEALLPGSVDCGEGWEDSPDTDYCYRFNKDTLNWREAQTSCKTYGGDLVSLENPEEVVYLTGRLENSQYGDAFWTGGNDLTAFTGWQWTDGKPFAFFHWKFNEPSANQSRNCVLLDGSNGRWNARSCMEHKPSVCKKLSNVINHPTPPPTMGPTNIPKDKLWGCPHGWSTLRGSCYQVIHQKGTTWEQANDYCHTISAEMAAITDEQENDYLFSLMPRGFKYAWIGMNDYSRRYNFLWSDGTPVSYTNWMSQQPDVGEGYSACVGMLESNGKWADNECNTNSDYFVCKKDKLLIDISQFDAYKGCSKGGKGYFNKCYMFMYDSTTFEKAQSNCQTILNGNLATLNDRYTQAFVTSEGRVSQYDYWIGLSNQKPTKTPYNDRAFLYTWKSGDKFDFANWDRDHQGSEEHTCVALRKGKPEGLWHNYECDKTFAYVCEYPRPGYSTPKTFTTTPSPLATCSSGWETIGHMCYKTIEDSKKSWMDAKSYCESSVSSGGTLASVTSAGLALTIRKTLLTNGKTYWIGLSDRDGEGGYKWAGGESFVYQNWGMGEPNNHNNQEDCGQWQLGNWNYNSWNDFNCYGAFNFICQAPKGAQAITTLPPPSIGPTNTQCGDKSWTMYKGYCYMVSKSNANSWSSSRKGCNGLGAELVSLVDDKENGYITTLLGQNSVDTAWIGLNDFDEDIYKWTDDTPLTFLSWAPNEPDNANEGERCATMKNNGFWYDNRCSKLLPFVCKKRPGNFSPVTQATTSKTKGGCPANFFGIPGTSRCFRVEGVARADRKSFVNANKACGQVMKHSRLASFHSDIDQEFVTSLIADLQTPVWIGMKSEDYSYQQGSTKYLWVDNTDTDYVHWASREPSETRTWGHKCSEMMIKPRVAGRWASVDCYDNLPYICEYRKSSVFPTNVPKLQGCPAGYLHFHDACYKYNPARQNWTAAQAHCAKDSGNLATEQGGFEKAFVDLIRQTNKQDWIWIGLSDIAGNDSFTWSSGWPVLYTVWADNQPDWTKHCVTHGPTSEWNTTDCSTELPSVCKMDLTGGSFVTPKVPGKCPSGLWTHIGEDCYYVNNKAASWPLAHFECLALGGVLATAHSGNDAKVMTFFLREEKVDAWIGLYRTFSSSSFMWSDHSEVEYFNWAPGSPATPDTKVSNDVSNNCVLAQGSDGKWSDAHCDQKHPYLCKVKQIPLTTTNAPTTATTATTATTTTTTTTTATTTAKITRLTTPSTTVSGPCKPNPCYRGSCIDTGFSYLCHCMRGWAGPRCDAMATTTPIKPTYTTPGSGSNPSGSGSPKASPVTHFPHNQGHNAHQTSGKSNSSSGLSSSGIAGIVVGVLCLVAIAVIGGFLFKRHRANLGSNNNTMTSSSSGAGLGFDNANYDVNNDSLELQATSTTPTSTSSSA